MTDDHSMKFCFCGNCECQSGKSFISMDSVRVQVKVSKVHLRIGHKGPQGEVNVK